MNFKDHENYNCIITTDTGETHKVYANWLHNTGNDHWYGWACAAGSTRISIDENLDVYGGACFNDRLGNINTGWELLTDMTICRRDRCSPCTDDLLVEKQKTQGE